ncbi:hypothetical protein DYI37_10005 [Fulvimarina endophytica]|uniref:Uncharacterized protein n=1 Tax=Fulvimarina endophytica TaxID=2293836 RepID=A0A371X2B9_9HYPH|nr:hypothetical protein [Fulvimarina endophytica]RFC63370.1 hypothetical protein DYI37_10005 [Fulvimarina endophytica]
MNLQQDVETIQDVDMRRQRIEMEIERLIRDCEATRMGYCAHLLEMARLAAQIAPVGSNRPRPKLNS